MTWVTWLGVQSGWLAHSSAARPAACGAAADVPAKGRSRHDELQSFSRELDEIGESTEKIEAKETFHLLDAVRNVISYLHMDKPKGGFSGSPTASYAVLRYAPFLVRGG